MLGWAVLNHLKQDPKTRHIPVQMLTMDEDWHHGLSRGAFSYVVKPTSQQGLEAAMNRIKEYSTPRRKKLLIVEDNPAEQFSITELLGSEDIDITVVDTGRRCAGKGRSGGVRLRGPGPSTARHVRRRGVGTDAAIPYAP